VKPYRNRTSPYKLLSALLYNTKLDKSVLEPGRVKFSSGDTARVLGISNSRLIDAVEWLKLNGIFTKVDYPLRGTIIVSIALPDVFKGGPGNE
jgi:hypothetical protein